MTRRSDFFIPVILVLAATPAFLLSDYRLFQLTMVAAYAIAILGLDMLTGYTGQISLGHGAFYAVGAYTAAILMANFDVPYWATLPIAALICAGFGFAFGFPALRLGGLYLALATFALAIAVPQLLKYKAFEAWTGGVQGIVISKPDPPFGVKLSQDQWLYLFTLAVAAVLFLLARNLLRGRIGLAMRAVRDHALAAEAMGVDLALLKTRTFAVSAMYTGIAGALGAIAVQFVAPDSFSVFVSITLFVGLVVGGITSLLGAVFGAIFIVFIPNFADKISKAAPGAIYGIILIAFLYLLPAGFAGLARRIIGPRRAPTHQGETS
ncbi:MAG: branched-chain amino acid ABC transporter permease [Acidibrevibacterium sp.]|uniref:branched-chain amino acid ABC transporter permease n=1 Tax=Acidibrevibacterium fodinaquatile TaxID=1969806 RepID=UPI0023A8D126|nr:branched-chain amino acid ABC transporter permease [Acidibrevibacterium fodinaquatile]MCA7119606.1 branched-chain amino acid ABC transporter permease [Acidibrevibacterium fodinaquatile]